MSRVFEAFSGIGSQRMALNNIGIKHEVVAIYYKAIDATNETSAYKQAGNSIAVPVLEGIFREIAKSINLID